MSGPPSTFDLAGTATAVPAGTLLASPRPMCLPCGADRIDAAAPCPACGSARIVLPASVASPIGSIHHYRKGMRKRLAMRIGTQGGTSTLLMHDGTTSVLPHDQLPPLATSPLPEDAFAALRSPLARLVRYGIAAENREVSLPWAGNALIDTALATAARDAIHARLVAVDLLTLDRPDLLDRVGLGTPEVTWLRLVHAARAGDIEQIVSHTASLPVDRYREKIAILATFLEQICSIPDAAERLRAALDHYTPSEPLAGVVRRALGIEPRDARQYAADIALRSQRFPLPAEVRAAISLSVTKSRDDVGDLDTESAGAILGNAGRLVYARAHQAAARTLRPSDLTNAPLAILDDLADAGTLDPDLVAVSERDDADITYLLGRIAPERLSDEQISALAHIEEELRRAFLRGDYATVRDGPDSATRRHLDALIALLHNRPQDVDLSRVAPESQPRAERVLAVLRTVLDGGDPIELFTESLLEDRTVWQPIINMIGLGNLRLTPEVRDRFPRFFEWVSLVAAREHLFLTRWEQAVRAARDCLAVTTDQAVRDEAHNLEACGLHYLGDNRSALRALESALEGSSSVALLANIGVVAGELDPELATTHLARIAREAPTLAMRVNAVRQAWHMWLGDDAKKWRGQDERQLPIVLRAPLRSIVNEPIDLADFRQIASALAEFDSAWLASDNSLKTSPHRDSLEARYFRARANGPLAEIGVLAAITDWTAAPAWIVDERDVLVEDTIDFLLDNINDPSEVAGAVAMELATKVHGVTGRARVFLSLLAVASLAYHLAEKGEEVGQASVDLVISARTSVTTLDADDRQVANDLLELATRRVALNLLQARTSELDAHVLPYNEALDALERVQPGTSWWFAARHVVNETIDTCLRCRTQINEWVPRVDHPDVLRDMHEFIEHTREFETAARWVLG